MRITNLRQLPEAVYRAILNDPYSPGSAAYTPSSLLRPVKIAALNREHHHEMEGDALDRIYAFEGQVIHAVLERIDMPGARKEERVQAMFDSFLVSGAFDLYLPVDIPRLIDKDTPGPDIAYPAGTIVDFKRVKAFSYVFSKGQPKEEHVAQVNILAELLRRNGELVTNGRLVLLFRDWDPADAKKNADYPQLPYVEVNVPLWSAAEVTDFVRRRIMSHEVAKGLPADDVPECSPSERWEKPEKFAIMKDGRASAVRVLNSRFEADLHMQTKGLSPGNHSIVRRPGESVRCRNWCSAAAWCHYGKAQLALAAEESE